MKISLIETILKDGLPPRQDDVPFHPGPQLPQIPGRFYLLTPYGGPGDDLDGLMDLPSFQVRSVGEQNSYDSAEDMALDADYVFQSWFSKKVGTVWVPSIVRVGGPPNVLMVDDSDRHHFVCSYTATVESAVA